MSTPVVVNPLTILEDGYGRSVGVTEDRRLKVDIVETAAPHAATHIHNGSDEIDGDKLDVDYSPSNYTQDTSPSEVTSSEELTSHLKGIDNEIGSLDDESSALADAIQIVRQGLDGYHPDITGQEHYQQHSQALQTILSSLDGYHPDITGQEHYQQHSQALQTILSSLDGYSSATFGSEYSYSESESESSTTSGTYQQKLKHTTSSLTSGTYRIEWYAEHRNSDPGDAVETRVELNDTTELAETKYYSESGRTDDFVVCSGFKEESLSGVNDIDIDWREDGDGTAYIRRARIAVWRIS